jgi:4-aminobutyrate---pyruvate transaminase
MPLANSLAARDIQSLVHPFTNVLKHRESGPLVIERGEGIHVYDDDGKRYIEGMAGLWCVSLGCSEPRLIAAAKAQMERLPYYHQFTSKSHAPGIELAEKLLEIAPVPMARVLFSNSGSEANDTQVKLVRYYHNVLGKPEKRKIISRQRAYHGVTLAAASLTGLPFAHDKFGLPLEGVLHTDCPHHYRFAEPGESEERFASRLAENLEKLILAEGPETIGAFIAEPVMGAGGVLTPPATYFEKIQAVLRKYDVLFIADEVICGFGRTGNMFGCQTYGLKPDLITVAKALSSAYLPISAVLMSEKVFDVLAEGSKTSQMFGHGYTYTGHPVSAAVALETLKIYEERDIVGHVREVSPRFVERVHALADHPLVGHTRAVGLIGALELMADGANREPFDPQLTVGPRVAAKAQERGLIIRAVQDNVCFSPPLIITADEVDRMFDITKQALDDVADELAREARSDVA